MEWLRRVGIRGAHCPQGGAVGVEDGQRHSVVVYRRDNRRHWFLWNPVVPVDDAPNTWLHHWNTPLFGCHFA